jgi:hypothetical protein
LPSNLFTEQTNLRRVEPNALTSLYKWGRP